jgi:CheY-like chemotaxis protein
VRILYLEDEVADAQLVERYTQLTGHELVIASDIQSAWASLEAPADLILVDVLLNKSRSGYAFVRELRAQGYQQPIIAVTGLALNADIEQCYSAGCNDVLLKPYAIKQLVALFDKYVS